MMPAPSALAHVEQLRAEAEAVDPDALRVTSLRLDREAPDGSATPARLRPQVTRLKFACTQAETRKLLIDRMYSGESLVSLDASVGLEEERRAAKARNRAVKRAITMEEEGHRRLQQQLEAAHARATGLREACLARAVGAAAELSATEPEASPLGSPMGSPRVSPRGSPRTRAAGGGWPADRCHKEAERGAMDASHATLAGIEVAKERGRLEQELRRVEAEARAYRRHADAAGLELEQEKRLAASLESVLEAEARLGLPRMDLDVDSGSLVLGGAGGEAAGQALCTLGLHFDDDGLLVCADAHPSLRLQKESSKAVALNDPARLVTATWEKVCKAASVDTRIACRGGA